MSGLFQYVSTYSRGAIAFVVLCVVAMYALALSGRPFASYAPLSPAPKHADRLAKPLPLKKNASVLLVASAHKLADIFDRIGYRLDDVRRRGGVPRLFLVRLPEDLTALRPVSDRKAVFIRAMLPLILRANEKILAERARLFALANLPGEEIGPADRAWLARIARRYRARATVPALLLRHVDIVPPSLALAQGAEESGWGTSRFALEGNSLYGQRVYRGRGGIVPRGREEGENHRIRSFERLSDAVAAYMHNLNSHPAYAEFRNVRAGMRSEGEPPDGHALAGALLRYSERGADYVEGLRTIMRTNRLSGYDGVRFDERAVNGAGESGA